MSEEKRNVCINLLRDEYAKHPDRYPKRSDFSDEQVQAIKAYLGPWPRALEAAGLKEANPEKAEKRVQKRIRAKIKIRNYKKEGKNR